MSDGANRDHIFKEYVETERKIKEALVDRNGGYKLSECNLIPRASSVLASDHNESYDVEQYEK